MVEFGELHEDGGYKHVRTISQSDIVACPHTILTPSHYRDDGSCRCNDEQHVEMREWGYTWDANEGRWT